jgi:hypothetical protein
VYPGAEDLTEEQVKDIREGIDRSFAGPTNAGRPKVLRGGPEWKPMSLTPADMDFVESQRQAAREIARGLARRRCCWGSRVMRHTPTIAKPTRRSGGSRCCLW